MKVDQYFFCPSRHLLPVASSFGFRHLVPFVLRSDSVAWPVSSPPLESLNILSGLSMAKEAVEDWRRFMQDMKVNKRKVSIHKGDGNFCYKKWHKIFVGDVVKVEKDHFFPADLLLLSSSYEDGICYVETMNLDGESNLKVKRALDVTLHFDEDKTFKDFYATIRCEDPNPSLYTFVGNLEYEKQVCSSFLHYIFFNL
ncbi:Putative phospholipid-transporting ATPase 7 [Dendrobium catenatum]|uniref:Phospholipid-transporting ATPase 7 n=1 Tax=Dendrobium catenatum TaxID=906689 RepID=A0A2I0W3R2_9ASPA|nr:Putative phospholipid-transporting ATPase 7 [Dendrobium catenatum]